MTLSSLVAVASAFQSASEELHDRFLEMRSDEACSNCRSAAFGEAILTAWIQTEWQKFTRALVLASALGGQRQDGTPVQPLPDVATRADAERVLKCATRTTVKELGYLAWHSPEFVLKVSTTLSLSNLPSLNSALGATLVPGQITAVRNVLVHPESKTRQRYERLQEKLGMLNVPPEHLLRQQHSPGVALFTSWVRELQSVADDSVQ